MRGIGRTRSRARDAAAGGVSYLSRARPVPLLAALCAVQLAITAWFAFETPHNGFVWYSGGDATEYWTSQWAVGHLRLTQTFIGWGLPVLLFVGATLTGTTLLSGLPVIVVFQALVLVPLTVVLVWLVADRLFGRLYAWGATALWIAAPLLLVWGMRKHDYRVQFEQNYLAPHVYGLTNMADFPSVVLTVACAWATLRAVDSETIEEWLFAGLLAGVAIGVKPANAFFLVGMIVLIALTTRVRGAVIFAVALAPALIVLLIWKQRGLGNVPLFAAGQVHEAAGPIVAADTTKYVPWDPHHLRMEMRDLMEDFWSVRLLEWIALAGIVAAIRRAPARGAFVAVWFVMYCIVKGSSSQAEGRQHDLLPPHRARASRIRPPHRGARLPRAASATPCGTPRAAADPSLGRRLTAILGAVVPLVLVLSLRAQSPTESTRTNRRARRPRLRSRMRSSRRRPPDRSPGDRWTGTARASSTPSIGSTQIPAGCTAPPSGARQCLFEGTIVGITRATSLHVRPDASYRVAAAANYLDEQNGGDLMLLGPPVTVP